MKLTPIPVVSEFADDLRGVLTRESGVSSLEVTSSGSTITVKALINPDSKAAVQSIIDDFKQRSGFAIVYDRRVNA